MDYSWKGSYPLTNPFGVYDPQSYGNYPGAKHPGEDYAVPANTQYYASMSGHVTVYDRPASVRTGRGKEVVITNGDVERIECHMNRITVKNGQWVNKGDPIGLSGNTGYVLPQPTKQYPNNGAHAHTEAKIKGVRVALSKHITEGGEDVFESDEEIIEAYLMLRGKKPTAAEIESWNGLSKQRFFQVGKAEADATRKQLADAKAEIAKLKASTGSGTAATPKQLAAEKAINSFADALKIK